MVKLKPVIGYLHRNHEKLAEKNTYLGVMPYTDRLDYFCSMTNNWAYALAVEKLAGIEVPERAEYLRSFRPKCSPPEPCVTDRVFAERYGGMGLPLIYAFREREKILDLFEAVSGSRMMCNYMRFGGCHTDVPPGWIEQARKVVEAFPFFLDELEALVVANEIVLARTQNIGQLTGDLAINAGVSGPMLRASGVDYDVRKVDGYGIYPRFKFCVPLGEHGDCYDRLMLRFLEMRESIPILKQALADIPNGPVQNPKVKLYNFRPPVGEAYGRIESPKGELGFYLISDGKANLYRCRIRPPGFINLTLLERLCLGHTVADVIVIFGRIDIVLGEVDR